MQEAERLRVENARLEAKKVADQRAEEAEHAAHAAALASASKTKMEAAEKDARRIAELAAQESARLEAARKEAQAAAGRRQAELKRFESARLEAQKLTGSSGIRRQDNTVICRPCGIGSCSTSKHRRKTFRRTRY